MPCAYRYDVYYAVNNGPFQLWLSNISTPDNNFIGRMDSTYSFFSIATDNAGNSETAKTVGEASTRIAGTQVILPINLLSFTARLSGKNSLLTWVTTSEQNSSYFSIERSIDGIQFQALPL